MALSHQQFAAWLQDTHPEVYAALYPLALQQGQRRAAQLQGLGDDGVTTTFDDTSVDLSSVDLNPDVANMSVNVSPDIVSAPDITAPNPSVMASTGGGGLASSIESVGNWIASPQGLTALTNLGTAIVKTQATQAVAQAQVAVMQAQAQRAQQGLAPVPISYTSGGTPVYNASTGIPLALEQAIQNGSAQPVTLPNGETGYTLTNPLMQNLLGTGFPLWMWLVLGAVLLAVTR